MKNRIENLYSPANDQGGSPRLPFDKEGLIKKPIDTRIFDGLCDIQGKPAGSKILGRIRQGDINQVVFFGEPGANKTTVLNQMRKILESEFEIKLMSFDESLSDAEVVMGPRSGWVPDQWAQFSFDLLYGMRRHKQETVQENEKRKSGEKPKLSIVETFSVGEVEISDRGVSALKILGVETAAMPKPDRLLIGMVPDRRTLERSWKIRGDVLAAEEHEVLERLKRYNITIGGYEKYPPRIAGRIAKQLVTRMSPPQNMKQIGHQVFAEAIDWARGEYEKLHGTERINRVINPIKAYRSVVEHVTVPPELPENSYAFLEFQFKAAHMQHIIREEFGFQKEKEEYAMVIFSPYTEGEITWYPLSSQ